MGCNVDDLKKLVWGIGIKGSTYPSSKNNKQLKKYVLWANMLRRCTEKRWLEKPAYFGTSCSENFKSYTFFYEWCDNQVGFGNKDDNDRYWSLDKDLLSNGERVYSENTCVFVPQRINLILGKLGTKTEGYPVGVFWDKENNKFRASCGDVSGKHKELGRFNTVEDAFKAYKTFKEAYIKEVAENYKEQLDPGVYTTLVNYTVKSTLSGV